MGIAGYRLSFRSLDGRSSHASSCLLGINPLSQMPNIFRCRFAATTNKYRFPKTSFPCSSNNSKQRFIPRQLCSVRTPYNKCERYEQNLQNFHCHLLPSPTPLSLCCKLPHSFHLDTRQDLPVPPDSLSPPNP